MNADDMNIVKISAEEVLANVLNTIYYSIGIIAIFAIIVAGFMYVTAQGDAGSITKAKNTILYSVIGMVVVFVAFTITNFVLGRF